VLRSIFPKDTHAVARTPPNPAGRHRPLLAALAALTAVDPGFARRCIIHRADGITTFRLYVRDEAGALRTRYLPVLDDFRTRAPDTWPIALEQALNIRLARYATVAGIPPSEVFSAITGHAPDDVIVSQIPVHMLWWKIHAAVSQHSPLSIHTTQKLDRRFSDILLASADFAVTSAKSQGTSRIVKLRGVHVDGTPGPAFEMHVDDLHEATATLHGVALAS